MLDEGTGRGGSGDAPQKGMRPLSDDRAKAYADWADANIGESIKNANAALGQLLTLSVSLLGGAIAFWNYIPFGVWLRFTVVLVLLMTVLVCLLAAMPSGGKFDRDNADDIKRYADAILTSKHKRLKFALSTLAAAITLLVCGLGYDALTSSRAAANPPQQTPCPKTP